MIQHRLMIVLQGLGLELKVTEHIIKTAIVSEYIFILPSDKGIEMNARAVIKIAPTISSLIPNQRLAISLAYHPLVCSFW